MNTQNKNKTRNKAIVFVSLLVLMLFSIFILPLATAPNIVGPNYKNVTIHTSVNITNAKPEVLFVNIYDASNISSNILISAGSTKGVYCNATVRDYDGYNDIVLVQGVLYNSQNTTLNGTDNNNSHYTNSSCTVNAQNNTYTGVYICSFNVTYYANNGTWNCTVNATDNFPKTGNGTGNITFYPVYALNVTDGIDYGNMAVEDTSGDFQANITNLGNRDINVTVEGYGLTRGDGLSMICNTSGNITVGAQHFGTAPGMAYASKFALTNTSTSIPNLTVRKQTEPNTPIINTTYWQLYIPPNPAGNCSGYIIFTATISQTP